MCSLKSVLSSIVSASFKENVSAYPVTNCLLGFLESEYFHLVFNANGDILYDSKEKFGTMKAQKEYMETDLTQYLNDILAAIKDGNKKEDNTVILTDEDDFIV